MKNIISIILVSIMLSFTNNSFALTIKKPDKSFVVSSKSRTIKMKKGQTYKMKMTLRKNRYYNIALKGKKFLGPLQCRIIVPDENNKVIFDNSAYEFDSNITFLNENNRNVIIEIRTKSYCFKSKITKKGNVKLVLANKKIKKNEKSNFNTDNNLYAIN